MINCSSGRTNRCPMILTLLRFQFVSLSAIIVHHFVFPVSLIFFRRFFTRNLQFTVLLRSCRLPSLRNARVFSQPPVDLQSTPLTAIDHAERREGVVCPVGEGTFPSGFAGNHFLSSVQSNFAKHGSHCAMHRASCGQQFALATNILLGPDEPAHWSLAD